MTTKKPPSRRNQSLVDFLANMDAIDTMLAQGYNMQWIFEKLQEKDGAISVSYWAFRRTLLKMRPQGPHKPRLAPVAGAKPSPTAPARTDGPQILGSTTKSFGDQLKDFAKEDPIGLNNKDR